MKQATGNLWTYDPEHTDVIVITTNGFVKANGSCVMGRGCAREARDRFKGIDKRLGALIRAHGNRPFNLMGYQNSKRKVRIVSFPTKHVWMDKSDIDLILQSALHLIEMADKFGWKHIVMPRPGCGNGGLNWDVTPDSTHSVKVSLQTILDDRFTVITHPERTRT